MAITALSCKVRRFFFNFIRRSDLGPQFEVLFFCNSGAVYIVADYEFRQGFPIGNYKRSQAAALAHTDMIVGFTLGNFKACLQKDLYQISA